MIEKLSCLLAHAIKNNGGDENVSVERMQFSLIIIISSLFIIFLSGLAGYLLSSTLKAFLSLAVIGLLRFFSGGWHLRTGVQCIVFTTAVVTLIILTPPLPNEFHLVLSLVSLLLVVLLAPTGHGQRLKTNRQRKLFKGISVMVVMFGYLVGDQTTMVSILCQSVTLITMKGGNRNEECSQNSFSGAV